MPDYRYVLYDTALFGATAGTEHNLFQVAQGADATHIESFTNMRGAGALPTEESFVVDRIGVMLDELGVLADVQNIWLLSFLEVRIADRTVLKAPLGLFAENNGFSGAIELAAAAAHAPMGKLGMGFNLDIPLAIPGGTAFRIRAYQGTAVAANTNVLFMLHGILTRP